MCVCLWASSYLVAFVPLVLFTMFCFYIFQAPPHIIYSITATTPRYSSSALHEKMLAAEKEKYNQCRCK